MTMSRVGKPRNLFHDSQLVSVGLTQNRMEGGHNRHLQAAQQLENMASSRAAKDSILVLQADHVDIVKVQEFRRSLIGGHIVLGERPTHACGIVVIHFPCRSPAVPSTGPYRIRRLWLRLQVGGEGSNSTSVVEDSCR